MNTDGGFNLASVFRWGGAVGVVSIAVMRSLTAFAPQVYFDLDPAIDPSPLAALGPAGSMWLDALLLLACAFALIGELLAGRRIEWRLIMLAAIPAPIVLWHGAHDVGDLWRGSTWLAAAFALVAVAHLSRDRTMRLVLLCALFAIVGPLLVRGLSQVTIEHAATVAQFEQSKEQFLRDRGWEPGSSSAQIYERRLRQAQPTGWFATTNIYGSVMAAAFVLFGGLAIGAMRLRDSRRWMIAAGILALISLVALYLTGSKGAILAALIGAAVLLALATRLVASHLLGFAPYVLIGLVPLTLLGVIVRGAFLPEDFLGDRSLLFRWHYLVSSVDIFRHAPLLGVGPDGYQQAYTIFRLPRNPEEVMSAHSVLVDWLCTLGVLSIAWMVLAFSMLWRAGKSVVFNVAGATDTTGLARSARTFSAVVVILGMFPAILVEQHVLEGVHFVLRVCGVVAFLAVAAVVAQLSERIEGAIVVIAAGVAAAVLLMHGQIEMTFYQPGAVVWAMCVLGLAGSTLVGCRAGDPGLSRPPASGSQTRRPMVIVALVLGALALWIAIAGAYPATVQSYRTAQAAQSLYPLSERLRERIEQRRFASATLRHAYEALPINVLPLHAAIRQLDLAAAESRDASERQQLLREALTMADRAVDSHRHSASYGIRAGLHVRLAFATGEPAHFDPAIEDLRRLVQIDPHGIQPWRRLGDVLWLAGRGEEAAGAYERALENDANFVLDPLKRLGVGEREELRMRIGEAAR